MVGGSCTLLGSSPESLSDSWQQSESSRLLFVGPLKVLKFRPDPTSPLDTAPFASIVRPHLDVHPFLESLKGLHQGFVSQVEDFGKRVEKTRRRFGRLTKGLRRSKSPAHSMRAGEDYTSEQALLGRRGLLLASISESASTVRRRKSKDARGSESGIQLVSSTIPTKSHITPRDLLVGAVAGGAAGLSVETALYPIDTIKTRIQVLAKGGSLSFKGLYAGLSGNLAGVLPASALFVAVYEPVKLTLLEKFPEKWSSAAHLLAAAAAGTGASIVRVPTEVIKQRMQTGQFTSAAGAVKQILAREGAKGLYAGYGSFLLRDLPFDAIEFVAYEQIKLAIQAATKRKELTALETALSGALAGAVTGAVTTPLDVIKTRLMVQGTNIKYTGIMDCISKTVAEEGAGALFKGVGPRVLWIGIGGSIFFGVLEKTKSLLTARLEVNDEYNRLKHTTAV